MQRKERVAIIGAGIQGVCTALFLQNKGFNVTLFDRDEPGNCGCLHSEENAVINCDSPRSIVKIVFVTHHPCVYWAKRLINLGNVKKVYYAKAYRNSSSKDIFNQAGIDLLALE